MSKCALRLAVIGTTLGLIGCSGGGGKTAVVAGKVTLAGKGPLPGGNIVFTPAGAPDKALTAAISGDGTYRVPGVPYGECKVTVDNLHLRSLPTRPGGTTAIEGTSTGAEVKYVKVDPKYAKAETSGLSTTVSGSTHTYDVELP